MQLIKRKDACTLPCIVLRYYHWLYNDQFTKQKLDINLDQVRSRNASQRPIVGEKNLRIIENFKLYKSNSEQKSKLTKFILIKKNCLSINVTLKNLTRTEVKITFNMSITNY